MDASPLPVTTNRIFLILNPVSGVTDPRLVCQRFAQIAGQAGWEFEIYQTTGDEDLRTVVQDAVRRGFSQIVAAGGDGTISEVATGLVGTEIPLGVLPVGTWNAFARNMGIPFGLDDAIRLQFEDHMMLPIDAIQVKERIYLLNISIGFTSAIIAQTSREQKQRMGLFAYVFSVLKQLTGFEMVAFDLMVDGQPVSTRASEVMLVNSSLVGMGELPTQLDIHPDDGILEIVILRARTAWDYILSMINVLIGRKHYQFSRYDVLRAVKTIRIQARRPVIVQADGEVIGGLPIEAKVLPLAVRVIVPNQPGGIRRFIDTLGREIQPMLDNLFFHEDPKLT